MYYLYLKLLKSINVCLFKIMFVSHLFSVIAPFVNNEQLFFSYFLLEITILYIFFIIFFSIKWFFSHKSCLNLFFL